MSHGKIAMTHSAVQELGKRPCLHDVGAQEGGRLGGEDNIVTLHPSKCMRRHV